jgi:hypothetical protein
VLLLFLLAFGLLQTFAWFYFLRHREEYFPQILDRVGGGLVGGVCGYIICSLLILTLCIMPCSVKGKVDWLCARDKMQSLSVPGVRKACNFLAWYSLECFAGETEKAIDKLLHLAEPQTQEEILYFVPEEPPMTLQENKLPEVE